MKGVYIDVETGSLDPETGAVLQIAAVAFDTDAEWNVAILDWISHDVMPHPDTFICERSLSVQGLRMSQINQRRDSPENTVYEYLTAFLVKHLGEDPQKWHSRIWAHYSQFDYAFVRQMALRSGGEVAKSHGWDKQTAWCCTRAYWKILQAKGLAPLGVSSRLSNMGPLLGVTNRSPHSALEDAICGARCLYQMLRLDRGEFSIHEKGAVE